MKTLYGIWCRRTRRRGQREDSYNWGWLRARGLKDEYLSFNKYDPAPEDGFMLREEAEAAALLIVAKHPGLLGWLEIRLFEVRDTTPGVSPEAFLRVTA